MTPTLRLVMASSTEEEEEDKDSLHTLPYAALICSRRLAPSFVDESMMELAVVVVLAVVCSGSVGR